MLEIIEDKKEIEKIILKDEGNLYIVLKYGDLKVTSAYKTEKGFFRIKVGKDPLFVHLDNMLKVEKTNDSYFLILK